MMLPFLSPAIRISSRNDASKHMVRAPKEDSNTATSKTFRDALTSLVFGNRASLMFHNLSTPLGSAVKM
uniref:Uncharacterized protein n=1 Tax=Arundo donax TaxID=35708 RepID=A0A0A9G929_ARUDO